MRAAAVGLALMPLLFALPTLNEPWGNSEESLNAAIWSLGAANMLQGHGRGTVVSPHGGTRGDGVYAHHPPLVVWLCALPVALGGWEGGPRLLAVLAACVALLLLHALLLRSFEPRAALVGLAVAALSTFALRYGRLLTTVTLAAPLLLALVLFQKKKWAPLLVALLVLSSWDGVIAAAVVVALSLSPVGERAGVRGPSEQRSEGPGVSLTAPSPHPVPLPDRGEGTRWLMLAAFLLSLAFVLWHLTQATGGLDDLLWQFRWRSAGDEVTWLQWLQAQALHLGEGLGPVSLVALLAVPFLLSQEKRVPFVLLLAPGLLMLVVFRQGAVKHAFWGYLLILPAAFAAAHVVTRWPKATALLALQLVLTAGLAVHRLSEEHAMNESLGPVAKTLPRDSTVPVFARRSFHPYVSWYAHSTPLTVRTLDELRATTHSPVLVDATHARTLGCSLEPQPPWQLVDRQSLVERCALIADAQPRVR